MIRLVFIVIKKNLILIYKAFTGASKKFSYVSKCCASERASNHNSGEVTYLVAIVGKTHAVVLPQYPNSVIKIEYILRLAINLMVFINKITHRYVQVLK